MKASEVVVENPEEVILKSFDLIKLKNNEEEAEINPPPEIQLETLVTLLLECSLILQHT